MIKLIVGADSGDGRQQLMFILDAENLSRLKQGKPIQFTLESLGIAGVVFGNGKATPASVVIHYKESAQAAIDEMVEHGLLTAEQAQKMVAGGTIQS